MKKVSMENLEDKMDIIEIIALYVKDYVSEKDFENWVYSHSKEIENQVDEELYLDLISSSYTNKNEVISLKNKLITLLNENYKDYYETINDAFIECKISENTHEELWENIKKKYERKEEIMLDFKEIDSSQKLHEYLKIKFELSNYYGKNWDAFEDLLYGDIILPRKIIIKNIKCLYEYSSYDAEMFKKLIIKHKKDCQIIFD